VLKSLERADRDIELCTLQGVGEPEIKGTLSDADQSIGGQGSPLVDRIGMDVGNRGPRLGAGQDHAAILRAQLPIGQRACGKVGRCAARRVFRTEQDFGLRQGDYMACHGAGWNQMRAGSLDGLVGECRDRLRSSEHPERRIFSHASDQKPAGDEMFDEGQGGQAAAQGFRDQSGVQG